MTSHPTILSIFLLLEMVKRLQQVRDESKTRAIRGISLGYISGDIEFGDRMLQSTHNWML
jgi:hypothetical protein